MSRCSSARELQQTVTSSVSADRATEIHSQLGLGVLAIIALVDEVDRLPAEYDPNMRALATILEEVYCYRTATLEEDLPLRASTSRDLQTSVRAGPSNTRIKRPKIVGSVATRTTLIYARIAPGVARRIEGQLNPMQLPSGELQVANITSGSIQNPFLGIPKLNQHLIAAVRALMSAASANVGMRAFHAQSLQRAFPKHSGTKANWTSNDYKPSANSGRKHMHALIRVVIAALCSPRAALGFNQAQAADNPRILHRRTLDHFS